MMRLKFEESKAGTDLSYASFDVIKALEGGGIAGNGATTDAVDATLTEFNPDEPTRVAGRMSYDSRDTGTSPEILAEGSFDVPFCV